MQLNDHPEYSLCVFLTLSIYETKRSIHNWSPNKKIEN